jgi:HAE1 family hydrophobic/amphiphilic exporter-1
MKSIVRFAVNNPVTIWMFILAVALLGIISFSRLGTDLFPNLNTPRLYIEINSGQRAPEEMESSFVENLESLAIRQKGVTTVKSDISVGSAMVTVEYDYDQDMNAAFLEMQKAIAVIEQNDLVDELNLSRYDPNASPVIEAALVSDDNKSMNDLRKVAEKYIVNDVVRIEGIADVKINGDEQSQIIIETNPDVLAINGLTTSSITNAISSYNRNVSGGYIEEAGQRYIIKGTGLFERPDDLLNLVVGYHTTTNTSTNTTTSTPILLSEVAKVTLGSSEPETYVKLNSKRCLGISVYKETSYNTVNAVQNLISEFEQIEKRLPGYKLVVVNNQGTIISDAVGEVKDSALMGMILAVLVIFVFLRRIGITLVVSIAIPVSVIATFNLMYFNGLTLNVMTLGGLALGAGMLVDNAIVAVENIFRLIEQGKSVREAAIDGVAGIGGAIISSTLTTIVVFLPVVYLQGASGELFKDQAWTVAFSLISSLFVAILLIPVMVNLFWRKKKATEIVPSGIRLNWYGTWLERAMKHRNTILLSSIVIIVLSGWLATRIGSEFMPNYQSRELTMSIKMPAGTSLERTRDVVGQVGNIVKDIVGENVNNLYSHTGPEESTTSTAGETSGDNTGKIKLLFTDETKTDLTALIAVCDERFKGIQGLEVEYHKGGSGLTSMLGNDDAPFEVQVTGQELDVLSSLTQEVKTGLSQIPDLMITHTSFEEGAPEVTVKIDRYRAGVFNIDVSTIMSQVSQYLQGVDGGDMDVNGELTDIKLKLPDISLNDLRNLKIKNGSNQYLLSELAQISQSSAPAQIERVNQVRVGKIQGYIMGSKPLSEIVAEVNNQLKSIEVPQGYRLKVAGEELKREESFGGLIFALILSIVLVYMVMAAQFESLIHPFTILLSIPLAGVGVILLFWITGNNFNMMALIGIVMLGGIAVNNAILLVDAINQNKWAGMDRRAAIVAAGQQRIRPILMTSGTTILGLLPLTFGFGESASLRSPMALAVIGGLVSSTLLTLVVIPCLYDVFDRFVKQDNEVERPNSEQ